MASYDDIRIALDRLADSADGFVYEIGRHTDERYDMVAIYVRHGGPNGDLRQNGIISLRYGERKAIIKDADTGATVLEVGFDEFYDALVEALRKRVYDALRKGGRGEVGV